VVLRDARRRHSRSFRALEGEAPTSEHEHQLNGALVTEMGQAFTAPILTAQAIATGLLIRHVTDPAEARVTANAAYDNGLRSWRLTSAKIGTEIEAHFSTDVTASWRQYTLAVTELYRLSATGFGERERAAWVDDVRAFVGSLGSGVDWDVLRSGERSSTFRNAFLVASEALLRSGDYLLQTVLSHRATNL
jgi:hypothetical protein